MAADRVDREKHCQYGTYCKCTPVRPVTRRVRYHVTNITLSAGIRQNLLSLQNTAANLTTTQEHLSTGKKVNTAFDNPTSYFTSQSLNNRANDLSALLDQIGQGQQTLDAANNGLTSLTSLLEQALSTAQQAQQTTPTAAAATTGSVALTSLNAGRQSVGQCRRHHLHGRDHGERSAVFDRKRRSTAPPASAPAAQ